MAADTFGRYVVPLEVSLFAESKEDAIELARSIVQHFNSNSGQTIFRVAGDASPHHATPQ